MNKRLGTVKDVATRLDVSQRAVWKWNASAKLPEPIRLGRSVRWDMNEVERWIDAGCPTRRNWDARKDVGE